MPTSALIIPDTASTIRALVITVSKATELVVMAAWPMPSLNTLNTKLQRKLGSPKSEILIEFTRALLSI